MSLSKIFTTTDADLASFLILEGIKFLEAEIHESDRNRVLLNFDDAKQQCSDLERVYLNSQFKKFRDINKYVLKKIHSKLRER